MRIPYGDSSVRIDAPGATVLRPPLPRARAIDAGFPGLDAFLGGAKRLAIVVADATRHTGVERLLPALLRRLRGRRVEAVLANGLHRPTTAQERAAILGVSMPTHDHDARRGLVDIGRSPRGVRIRVNRHLTSVDRVIVTGTVGLHYLAGYGGGWKMVFPGCAGEETILGLHRLTILEGAERCEPGRVDGNPFRSEIDACGARFPVPAFAIQTVLAANRRIVGVFCGEPLAAHRAAVREAARWHTVPVAKRVDRLIASAGGHPKDINLIQAHKAIDHASRALLPGGELIVYAACPDGLGYPGFERWFAYGSPARLAAALRRKFHVYGRTAWALWKKAERYRIRLVSQLPADLVRALHLQPLDFARGKPAAPARAGAVFPDAGSVLPIVSRAE